MNTQIQMHPNEQTITNFYQCFKTHNAKGMCTCYHDDVVFEDPAFGILHGERAKNMWHMLIERGKDSLQIELGTVEANEKNGRAKWKATYLFGKDKRKIVNDVTAHFAFKDGLIIEHKDVFDLWKWTKQALGLSGALLGWSSFMKKKVQATTAKTLDKYIPTQAKLCFLIGVGITVP